MRAIDNGVTQADHCSSPFALADATVLWVSNPVGERLCEEVAQKLRIGRPEDNGIVLVAWDRPIGVVVRVKDEDWISPIELLHGGQVEAFDRRFLLPL